MTDAARGRQVRQERVQGVRRSARRRRVSVVNALSEWLEVEVAARRARSTGSGYSRGAKLTELEGHRQGEGDGHDGLVQARPRDLHRADVQLRHAVATGCASWRSSTRGCGSRSRTSATGARTRREEYHYEGGIIEFVDVPARHRASRCTPKPIYIEASREEAEIELAIQYDDGYNENTFTFVNNINTHEGGTHLTGLQGRAHAHAERLRAQEQPAQEGARQPLGRRRARGADGVLSVKVPRAAVRGADQDEAGQLGGAGRGRAGRQREALDVPGREPVGRPRRSSRRRSRRRVRAIAARKARDLARRKNALEGSVLPGQAGRLLDHRSGRSCELYLVEGDSRRRHAPSRGATGRTRRSCRCAARS